MKCSPQGKAAPPGKVVLKFVSYEKKTKMPRHGAHLGSDCKTCHSLFFRLPLEIREKIYDYMLPEDVPDECYPDWSRFEGIENTPRVLPRMLVLVKHPKILHLWGEARDHCHKYMRFMERTLNGKHIKLPYRPYRSDIDTLCVHTSDIDGYCDWAEHMHEYFPNVQKTEAELGAEAFEKATRPAGSLVRTAVHDGYHYKPWEIQRLRIGTTGLYTPWTPVNPLLDADIDECELIGEILFSLRGHNSFANRHVEIVNLSDNTGITNRRHPQHLQHLAADLFYGSLRNPTKVPSDVVVGTDTAKGTLSEFQCAVTRVLGLVVLVVLEWAHLDPTSAIDWGPWSREFADWAIFGENIHAEIPRHSVCTFNHDKKGCFEWNGVYARPRGSREWHWRTKLLG